MGSTISAKCVKCGAFVSGWVQRREGSCCWRCNEHERLHSAIEDHDREHLQGDSWHRHYQGERWVNIPVVERTKLLSREYAGEPKEE